MNKYNNILIKVNNAGVNFHHAVVSDSSSRLLIMCNPGSVTRSMRLPVKGGIPDKISFCSYFLVDRLSSELFGYIQM